eukprot:12184903-Karenia_brevis.AAC.1
MIPQLEGCVNTRSTSSSTTSAHLEPFKLPQLNGCVITLDTVGSFSTQSCLVRAEVRFAFKKERAVPGPKACLAAAIASTAL